MPGPHRLQTTAPATIWRGRDPNYPGIPQPDTPAVVTRTASRTNVLYEDYVFRYAARLVLYALLMTTGLVLAIGAAVSLPGLARLLLTALGAGIALGGLIGIAAVRGAHRTYTRYLAVTHSETREENQPPPADDLRPIVPANDGTATVKVGRFSLSRATWAALFNTAAANGGRLTRDAATAILPRELYRDWQATVGELQRLGYIDDECRPTSAAWAFIGRRPPFPHGDEPPAGAHSTHARRTHDAHGASGVGE